MKAKSSSDKSDELIELSVAWQIYCPDKKIGGYTLAQYQEIVRPLLELRAEMKALETQKRLAQQKQVEADAASLALTEKVLEDVRLKYGEDSELYRQMIGELPLSPRKGKKKAKSKTKNRKKSH